MKIYNIYYYIVGKDSKYDIKKCPYIPSDFETREETFIPSKGQEISVYCDDTKKYKYFKVLDVMFSISMGYLERKSVWDEVERAPQIDDIHIVITEI